MVLTMLKLAPALVLLLSSAWSSSGQEMNQLLWIKGSGQVYLVDLSDPSAPACDLPSYPGGAPPIALTFADSFGLAFACGSFGNKDNKNCYIFDGSEWRSFEGGDLIGEHYPYVWGTYNAMMPGLGWWIGGTKSTNYGWNSEIYTADGWLALPLDSPYPGDYGLFPSKMCSVILNSTHILMTGGIEDYSHNTYTDTWLLDLANLEWSKSTPMLGNGRMSHACGLNSAGELVVAGGWEHNNIVLDSVQILNLVSGEWREAGTVPEGIDTNYPVMLTWQDQLIMLSRDSSDIWIMAEDGWTPAEATLPGTFVGGGDAAIMVSDEFKNACKFE